MTTVLSLHALALYLFTMMVSLTPLEKHSFYEKQSATFARYKDISETIARAVLGQTMADDERLQVGAVMVSIGDAESHWNAKVVSCEVGGDNDKAWGPWQTQLPKSKVCQSTDSAVKLAMGMVKTSFLACKHLPVSDRLSWYTDGRCIRDWKRSSWRMNRALAWVSNHPFTVNVTPFSANAFEVL